MGIAIALLHFLAERLNRTRVGRAITTGVATVVIVWAFLVAILTTTLLGLAVTGNYP